MLHRYAVFLAAFAMVVVVSGAFVTSVEIAARQTQSAVSGATGEALHRDLGMALAFFTLGLAIWTSFAPSPGWLRALSWIALAPVLPAPAIVHALLAHFSFAVIVAVAVATSPRWNRREEPAAGGVPSSLLSLAFATPPVVFLQIALGTAYRQEVIGIKPHMAGAMAVALMTLILSVLILQNSLGPPPVRRAAAVLISVVLTQVCLGIASFLMLLLNAAGTLAFVLATAGHVSIGAATLAASVVMAMQLWRRAAARSRRSIARRT